MKQLFFSPPHKWVSDLEIFYHQNEIYCFFIQNQKDTDGHSYAGHNQKDSYGLAISQDGFFWEYQGTIFEAGKSQKSNWNHHSLWAKSIFKHHETFYLFYSAVSPQGQDQHPFQQVGLAQSTNLIDWTPVKDEPIITTDQTAPYYLPANIAKFCWRDPIVYHHQGKFYCTLAAKDQTKTYERSGCVALLESDDLINWKTLPPLFSPGIYWEVETPQIAKVDGKHFLIYGTYTNKRSMRFAYSENGLLGPYCDTPHIFTPAGCYAGRIREIEGQTYFYHWIMNMQIGRNTRVIAPPKILKRIDNELFALKHPKLDNYFRSTQEPPQNILQKLQDHPQKRGHFKFTSKTGQAQISIRAQNRKFDQDMLINETNHGLSLRNFTLKPEVSPLDLRTMPIFPNKNMSIELFFEGPHLEVYVNSYLAFTHIIDNSLDTIQNIIVKDTQWTE